MRNPFRRRDDRRLPPEPADLAERVEAEAAKQHAVDTYERISAMSGAIRTEVDALRDDRHRNHYAEALEWALYARRGCP